MRPQVELWTGSAGIPGVTRRQARQAEAEGWDGFVLVDSQNLAADPYVELAMAADATERITLGTGVTNPVTRHPAVTATAIMTVDGESGGRAVLGIGRGDSALAHLGLAPAPVAVFRRYVERLQAYLRLEAVPFDESDGGGRIPSVESLGLADQPADSRIRWNPTARKVPLDVAATGPRVISLGAVHAERLTFMLGAEVERLRWSIKVANEARTAAGATHQLAFGAYVPVAVHDDRATARSLLAGVIGSTARFSAMHGAVTVPASTAVRAGLGVVHDNYDMNRHFSHGSAQSAVVSDDVADSFGIAGPAAYCIERLQEIAELGITTISIMGPARGVSSEESRAARRRFVDLVLPEVKS